MGLEKLLFLYSATGLILVSLLLRMGFLLFGLYQDATMEVKYTDTDYIVFTDAARYVYHGFQSPYLRETYRYTPLLAYLLAPTAIEVPGSQVLELVCFSFGKFVFIVSDLITGILILKVLDYIDGNEGAEKHQNSAPKSYKNLILSAIWLLNPMVITISTRGSSESFLTVLLMLFVYFLIVRQSLLLSGIFYGLAIHFKIYPVIFLPSVGLYLIYKNINVNPRNRSLNFQNAVLQPILSSLGPLLLFGLSTVATFASLGLVMYKIYGYEFLFNSYLYHFIRTDHRHNFSIYNLSLYFISSINAANGTSLDPYSSSFSVLAHLDFTKFAFVPQFLVSTILIPVSLNFNFTFNSRNQSRNVSKDKALLLLVSFFLQTFAFVNYNKVITSQYFIWYLVFLPFLLKKSVLITARGKWKGASLLGVWVAGQAVWLYNAYKLEFLGQATFYPGLFASAVLFFIGNTWVLGELMDDVFETFF